ncbi:MAG: hypothetical protein E6612_09535, partial [Paeniclostridium sordellii]|nr:hypothetical protein [Paeniclostridium sordellii]
RGALPAHPGRVPLHEEQEPHPQLGAAGRGGVPGNILIIIKFKAYPKLTVNISIKKEDIADINAYLCPVIVEIIAYGTGIINNSNPINGI